jgi:predicted aldo/keto reductase-like oxidoreductase
MGKALSDVRENIYIASKTKGLTPEDVWKDLETSLKNLKTDYIDLYQFHDPPFCPKPGDESGIYDAFLEAKEEGLIKHIGITSHKNALANKEIKSGLFETLQYPFSYLSDEKDIRIINLCKEENMGFIAMKALSGGLLSNSKAAYTFMEQYPNVLPIWGIQKESELDEFLKWDKIQPKMDDEIKAIIEKDREELQGNFCRGCAYCLPCEEGIQINMCARMSLWIRRFPTEPYLTKEYQDMMNKTLDCKECGECMKRCPYDLNIPELLKENYEDYQNVLSGKTKIE